MTPKTWLALALIALAPTLTRGDAPEEKVDGTWIPTKAVIGGQALPDEVLKTIKLELDGEKYTVTLGDRTDSGTCKWDESADPKTLDIVGSKGPNEGKTILAIYERDGDTMRVCYDLTGKERPRELNSPEGSQRFLVEYERLKPKP